MFQGRTAAGLGAVALASAAVAAVVLLLTAPRAPLTSDESLYISEALNIAKGIGPRYTTHEFIQHRPFLFPALLAVPLRVTGDFTSVYWVTKSVVLLNVLAVALLVYRLRGELAALFTVALVLPNAFLNSMGVSAYLDGTETLFLLVSMILLWEGFQRQSSRWWAAAGGVLGLAFLTKEAATLWLPLPFVFALLTCSSRNTRWAVAATVAWYAAFVAVAGWWWPYVYAVDGRVYLWPGSAPTLLVAAGGVLVLAATGTAAYHIAERRSHAVAQWFPRYAGIAVAVAWVAAFAVVMETTSWPYPKDFAATVPRYLRDVVAGNVTPWPPTACALAWIMWRAWRHEPERLLALAFLLWLPFATFVANRNFALRDLLPMIYVLYAGAGIVLADVTQWVRRQAGGTTGIIAVGAIVAALAAVGVAGERTFYHDAREPRTVADWDNELVRRTAAWLDAEAVPGTPIMSSRLYFSQLYTLTDARFPIEQLPTVNVVPKPGRQPYLAPRSTLFRWEDGLLGPPRADQRWITVDQFAQKRYFTALSEDDLLAGLRQSRVGYLIISGEDEAFSSTRYLDYFRMNPAFTLLHEDHQESASVYIFGIDRRRLAPRDFATVVPAPVLNHLYAQYRGGLTPQEFVDAISPRGVVVRPSAGLAADLRGVTTQGD